MSSKKIVVIGPESTGKSFLCQQLAAHFDGILVEEYAREFLQKNGTDYNYEDLWTITQGQIKKEEEGLKKAIDGGQQKLMFIDTDLYVIKVWSEYVFGKCDNRILSNIAQRNYDLYLLCRPDIPWVEDEMREYPDLEKRRTLFYHYKELLTQQQTPWTIINGDFEDRLKQAVSAVKLLI